MKKVIASVALLSMMMTVAPVFAAGSSTGGSVNTNAAAEAKAAQEAAAAKAAQEAAAAKAAQEAAAAKAAQEAAAAKAAQEAAAAKAAQEAAAAKAAQEAAAAKAAQEAAAAQAAANAEAEAKVEAETPAATVNTTTSVEATTTTTVAEEDKEETACYQLESRKERIRCRMEASVEQLVAEREEGGFNEESCLGDFSEAWIEKCNERYAKLQAAWDYKRGPQRIAKVKELLGLPQKLVSSAEYCEGKDEECAESYKKNIHHLIIFRFYDLQELAETWYADGKISLDVTVDFVDFIVASKIKFYEAKTKGERVKIINQVQAEWDDLVSTL